MPDKIKGTDLATVAQNEALTRPVIGGQGVDATRQAELDSEIGLAPEVVKAKKDLASGKATPEQVEKAAGVRQD